VTTERLSGAPSIAYPLLIDRVEGAASLQRSATARRFSAALPADGTVNKHATTRRPRLSRNRSAGRAQRLRLSVRQHGSPCAYVVSLRQESASGGMRGKMDLQSEIAAYEAELGNVTIGRRSGGDRAQKTRDLPCALQLEHHHFSSVTWATASVLENVRASWQRGSLGRCFGYGVGSSSGRRRGDGRGYTPRSRL